MQYRIESVAESNSAAVLCSWKIASGRSRSSLWPVTTPAKFDLDARQGRRSCYQTLRRGRPDGQLFVPEAHGAPSVQDILGIRSQPEKREIWSHTRSHTRK